MSQTTQDPTEDELRLLGSTSPDGFIHRILSALSLSLIQTKRASQGNNTTTFILTVVPQFTEAREAASDGVSSVGFCLAGTSPLPSVSAEGPANLVFSTSKVVEDMDAMLLVENRVAAMHLARQNGRISHLIPRVYGWSKGAGEDKQTWALMEFMPGVPLSTLWESLPFGRKLLALPSLARSFAAIQRTALPSSATPYGAFTFLDASSADSQVTISPSCFHYGGPYATAADLYKGYISTQYDALRGNKWLDGWRGTEVELKDGRTVDLGAALEELRGKIQDGGGWWDQMTDFEADGAVFIHGDYGEVNILVDPEPLEPTAILDFEFAQSGPVLDEYFQSFGSLGLIVEGSRNCPSLPDEVLDDERSAEVVAEIQEEIRGFHERQDLLFRDGPTAPPMPASERGTGLDKDTANPSLPEEQRLALVLVNLLREAGARGPWSFDPANVDRQANVYWFAQDLCSGLLQRETFWTREGEAAERRRRGKKEGTAKCLARDVRRWL